jgi:hypothetical protein
MKDKFFTITVRLSYTPQEMCDYFNYRFDAEFTPEDLERNWDAIQKYVDKVGSECAEEALWEDFSLCAEDWDIDLFN